MKERFARDLLRGSLDLMVLSVLSDAPQYGYNIQKRLREASEDMVRLEAGTMYPLLHRLEAEKLIASRWDDSTGRRRKWYELTAAGRRKLVTRTNQWRQYADCILRLIGPAAKTSPDPA